MSTASATQTVAIKRATCRHIFADGHRCGSPCLRLEQFCYYHHPTRKVVTDPRQRRACRNILNLPKPVDRAAIQLSIGEVLQSISSKAIDPRRAALMLYGLQIAKSSLPREPGGA